ncbi:MAG TPA: DUF4153 domain-containing protein [Gemmatimonadaceae bacterium]|nr:DUF4153 domain-containing protein [Gemmatimonadaceae bacterium]
MALPPASALARRAWRVFARFPITIAFAVAATTLGIVATTNGASEAWTRGAFVAALGLPLFFGIRLVAEYRRWAVRWWLLLVAGGAAVLAGFYLTWRGMDDYGALQYFQLSAVLHLAAAVLPLVGVRDEDAFWQYNRRLFLGFLRAAVYAVVLFVGLCIAFGAVDHLMGLEISDKGYFRLWLVMAIVVTTWVFVSSAPRLEELRSPQEVYPRGLKLFTQYVLTPLVAVYLAILLAYLGKILITGQWPRGWIGWLVSSVSVAGILGFLLVHPLRNDPDEGWIRLYQRWLFVPLIPAVVMLLLAVAKRIAAYGVTELRYLGVVLGVWLIAIALLFIVRREHGIRVIPISLALVLLVTLGGPLGATHRAVANQAGRLERAVRIARAGPSLQLPDAVSRASGALEFLVQRRAQGAIARVFGGRIPGNPKWPDAFGYGTTDSLSRGIMTAAGFDYNPPQGARDSRRVEYDAAWSGVDVTGFRWLVSIDSDDTLLTIGADTLHVITDSTRRRVTIRSGGHPQLMFDLQPLVDSLRAAPDTGEGQRQRDPSALRIAPAHGKDGALQLFSVGIWLAGDSVRSLDWHGYLLLANSWRATTASAPGAPQPTSP